MTSPYGPAGIMSLLVEAGNDGAAAIRCAVIVAIARTRLWSLSASAWMFLTDRALHDRLTTGLRGAQLRRADPGFSYPM
jgi:hypothetical protein